MSQKISIVLDDKLVVKLRKKQADAIRNSSKNVSLSKIISDVIEAGLK